MLLTQSVKKYSLKYVHCPHGGLHTGEVMNMVCVDSGCSHRGLVCPICRMEHHQNHQILPIKTFLEHIRSMFTQSDNNQQLNNLSDYLRALQNSKKDIIANLRAEVARLADSFKSLEEKIEENFAAVRKNVLIQSSITTKLPSLLTLLTEENANKDGQLIREQFKKYTQLLKYENDKLKVSDKAKALVQNYSSIPQRLRELLQTYSGEYTKKLQSLPRFFEQKQKASQANSQTVQYTFSTQNKYFDILLEENNKLAKAPEYLEEVGYIFVNEKKGATKQKIVIEIVANNSDQISLGLGDVDAFRDQCSFINQKTMDTKKDLYQGIYSSGYQKLFDSDQDSEEIEDQATTPPFNTGDIIEIEYNGSSMTFFNRISQTTHTVNTGFSQKAKPNLQFVIGLGSSDSVRILEQ